MARKQKHVLRKRRRKVRWSALSALCVCIALSYLFGPIILAGALGDYHNEEKLYSTGISTTGTVTAINSTSKTTIAEGDFVTITGQVLSFQYEIYNPKNAYIGETVALLYNPNFPYAPDGLFVGTRDEIWGTSQGEFFAGVGILLFAVIGTITIIVIIRWESRSDPYRNRFKRLKKVKPDKRPGKPLL